MQLLESGVGSPCRPKRGKNNSVSVANGLSRHKMDTTVQLRKSGTVGFSPLKMEEQCKYWSGALGAVAVTKKEATVQSLLSGFVGFQLSEKRKNNARPQWTEKSKTLQLLEISAEGLSRS